MVKCNICDSTQMQDKEKFFEARALFSLNSIKISWWQSPEVEYFKLHGFVITSTKYNSSGKPIEYIFRKSIV